MSKRLWLVDVNRMAAIKIHHSEGSHCKLLDMNPCKHSTGGPSGLPASSTCRPFGPRSATRIGGQVIETSGRTRCSVLGDYGTKLIWAGAVKNHAIAAEVELAPDGLHTLGGGAGCLLYTSDAADE